MRKLKKLLFIIGIAAITLTSSMHGDAIRKKDNKIFQSPKYAMESAINRYSDKEDESSFDKRREVLKMFELSTREEFEHIDFGDVSRSSKLSVEEIEKLLPDNLKQLSGYIYLRDTIEGPDKINAIYLISQIKIFTANGNKIYGNNLFGVRNRAGSREGKLKVYNSYLDSLNDYIYFLHKRIINLTPDAYDERTVAYICYMADFPYDWAVTTYQICIDLNNQCI